MRLSEKEMIALGGIVACHRAGFPGIAIPVLTEMMPFSLGSDEADLMLRHFEVQKIVERQTKMGPNIFSPTNLGITMERASAHEIWKMVGRTKTRELSDDRRQSISTSPVVNISNMFSPQIENRADSSASTTVSKDGDVSDNAGWTNVGVAVAAIIVAILIALFA
ncbi:MAG: hypothetical protein WA906_01030 [Pacificimonas sp.]